jgi:hypothetical protein
MASRQAASREARAYGRADARQASGPAEPRDACLHCSQVRQPDGPAMYLRRTSRVPGGMSARVTADCRDRIYLANPRS